MIFFKLENRLVNHRIIETQLFYWIFKKLMGFWFQNSQQNRLIVIACLLPADWKGQAIFNISAFWPSSRHFSQNLMSAINFSSENTSHIEVSASWINAFLMLKTACNFQAALNQASHSQQPNLLTDLDSAFHEFFKKSIKFWL